MLKTYDSLVRVFLVVGVVWSSIGPACASSGERSRCEPPPLLPKSAECLREVEEVDSKFTFRTSLGEFKITDADPDRLCAANRNAYHDKALSSDSQAARSCNDNSVCRVTWTSLRDAVKDYKAKLRAFCEQLRDLGRDCCAGRLSEDPKESNRCMARSLRQAERAQRQASSALVEANRLSEDLGKHVERVESRYQSDLHKIRQAFEDNAEKIRSASASGNQSEVQRLQRLAAEAQVVVNGELSASSGILPALSSTSPAGAGEASSLNGGQISLSSYRLLLGESQPGQVAPRIQGAATDARGLLVDEQQWARGAVESFKSTAGQEIQRLNGRADIFADLANRNETAVLGNARSPASTLSTGASSLPSTNSLLAASGAASSLAGMANRSGSSQAGSISSSLPAGSRSLVGGSNEERGGALSASGFAARGNDFRASAPARVPQDNLLRESGSRSPNSGGTTYTGGGREGGQAFVSGNGDLPSFRAASSGASSPSAAKLGAGGGRLGAGKGSRDLARSGKSAAADCAPEDQACSTAESLEAATSEAGVLASASSSGGGPPLDTAGVLDSLLGPITPAKSEGDPANTALLSDASFSSASLLGANGEGSSLEQGSAQDLAPASSGSLFARVHVMHEKALRKGTVSLFHKKLE